jgi:hypothetical protein
VSVLVKIRDEQSGMEKHIAFQDWPEALEWLQKMEGQYTELRAYRTEPAKIRQGRE